MTIDTMAQAGRIPVWTKADRLRKARESAGLEQAELAALTGLSRQTIGNYENGRVEPRRSGLNLWALATGVSVGWIVNGEEPPSGGDGGSSVEECTPRDLNPEPTDSGPIDLASYRRAA